MKLPALQRRTLALVAVVVPLVAMLAYVAMRSGPLAPVAVTVEPVASMAIRPSLFGIGTVEARYAYPVGPTTAGRVKQLSVDVGDSVRAGQLLAEMDPVDLDDRQHAQEAALKRAGAVVQEATARQAYAATQADRYQQLFASRNTSEELLLAKQQELAITEAALAAARQDQSRLQSERDALRAQRGNLRLLAPSDGIITGRNAEPGTTVVAGQAVVELINPQSLWINARFDQSGADGLAANLPARIVLRSRSGSGLSGRVLRVEPTADAVTEEIMAKVVFDTIPTPLPPLGELAEVTIDLPALPAMPVIPNAALQRQGSQPGVWQVRDDSLHFVPVKLGRSDLDGHVQVLDGLQAGDRIVVYSEKPLTAGSKIRLVDRIPGVAP